MNQSKIPAYFCGDAKTPVHDRLKSAGIRPTRIRVALGELLFDGKDKHVTAKDMVRLAQAKNIRTSVASIYNTLNQFSDAKLLKRISVDSKPVFFDTNTDNHYHLYHEDTHSLKDVPSDFVQITDLPSINRKQTISSVDFAVRVVDKI